MAFKRFNKEAASGVVAAICLVGGNAHAQTTAGVDITVTATVADRCGFQTGASPVLEANADLEYPNNQEVRFRIDCNTPFTISARAGGGRLVNRSSADDGSGYAFDKVYGVTVKLNTDVGQVVSGRCPSDELHEGGRCVLAQPAGLASGDGIAIRRDATLTVDWPSQNTLGRRLAAGQYSDTITLTIGART